MLWREDIPIVKVQDSQDKSVEIKIIAGDYFDTKAPKSAPNSWAGEKDNDVAIWIIKMMPGAQWELPKSNSGINRSLYFYKGKQLKINDYTIQNNHSVDLLADQTTVLKNGNVESHLLLLQGRPINEPVAKQGPFVMNTPQEINEAILEFRETAFGGWPWPTYDHTHPRERGRFALHADGREESR